MAKRPNTTPVEHHWVCETCGCVWEGVNPPDECSHCGCEYHENLKDMLGDAEEVAA